MKLLIAVDMEGISGVVHWDHVMPGRADYSRFCRIMTADINAAIRGAVEGGATDIQIADGHAEARNVIIEDLDVRARLNCGKPSPLSMVQGVDQGVNAAFFIGYHARVGTKYAVLDHTWSNKCIAGVWLNGNPIGEIGLNAAICGHFNVPVLLISGDKAACAEAEELIPGIDTAVTKEAYGRMSASCLTPTAVQAIIQEKAKSAVEKYIKGEAPVPMRVDQPMELVIKFSTTNMTDAVMSLPYVVRSGAREVSMKIENICDGVIAARAALTLANA